MIDLIMKVLETDMAGLTRGQLAFLVATLIKYLSVGRLRVRS